MSDEVLIPNFFKVGCNGDKAVREETWGGLTPLREMSSLITQRRFSDMLWRYWD